MGYWLGLNGIAVINNVRWGDESTYSYCFVGVCTEFRAVNELLWKGSKLSDIKITAPIKPRNNIKTISNSLGCNFLEAKNLLQKGEKIIEDKATVIKDKALELKNNNILYTIIPNFPYPIEKLKK